MLLRGLAWSLRAALAGTIRLTWRALELHGRHTGYDVAAWESEAAYGAQAVVVVAVDPSRRTCRPRREHHPGVLFIMDAFGRHTTPALTYSKPHRHYETR